MSVPRRNPPSTSTGTRPSTASTISGSTVIGAWTESSCRPPWLETTIPSTPTSTAIRASSAVMIPFTSSGTGAASRIHERSSHVRSGANVSSSCGRPIGMSKSLRVSRWRRPLDGEVHGQAHGREPGGVHPVQHVDGLAAIGEHVQLPPLRSVRGTGDVLEVVDRRARDHHDGLGPGGGARGGELPIRVRALLIRPRRDEDRGVDARPQQLDRGIHRPGSGEHPRPDHPALEGTPVLGEGPFVSRPTRVVVVDIGRQTLAGERLVVVDRDDLRRIHGTQPKGVRAVTVGPPS